MTLRSGTDPRVMAAAFVAATLAGLAGNAVLQLLLDALAIRSAGGAPWWITAGVVERGRWVVMALLLQVLAARLSVSGERGAAPPDAGDRGSPRSDTWRLVGALVLIVPLLWVVAAWIVSALRFTALGSWETEGRVFLAAEYYRGVLVDYAPWLMGGVVVRGIARHL